MSSEELRRRMAEIPFRIVAVNVADGRRLSIVARDFLLISESGRVVSVFERDGVTELLDCLLITGLSLSPTAVPTDAE